jgi:hypothetical protein
MASLRAKVLRPQMKKSSFKVLLVVSGCASLNSAAATEVEVSMLR